MIWQTWVKRFRYLQPRETEIFQRQNGFTLIEIVMVLALLGIMGVAVGLGLNQVVKGYIFSKEAAETTGKAQLAMLRLSKEFRAINKVDSGSTTDAISFTSLDNTGTEQSYDLTLSSGELKLDSNILVDGVSSIELKYYQAKNPPGADFAGRFEEISKPIASNSPPLKIKFIEVALTLSGPNAEPTLFKTRVIPRNIEND